MTLDASYRYTEAGNWARHFSSIRASLTTFLLTVSIGIVAARWDVTTPSPFWVLAGVAASVWLLALVLLLAFSRMTYAMIQRQNDIESAECVQSNFGSPRNKGWLDLPVIVFIILSIGFGYLLYAWHQHATTFQPPGGAEYRAEASG